VRRQRRREGCDGEDSGSDRNCDREHIVDEQGCSSDEAGKRAEIVLRDDVGTTARLICANGLSIGGNDDREQPRDGEGNREDEMSRSR